MAYDEALVERIRKVLKGEPDISERKMFGGIAFMAGDSMFVGVNKDELMARVGVDSHDEAMARKGARPMDFTGRAMKGFLFVGAEGVANDSDLKGWVDQCLDFARSLPPKKAKDSRSKSGRT